MTSRSVSVAVVAAACLLLAACGSGDTEPVSAPTGSPTATEGQTGAAAATEGQTGAAAADVCAARDDLRESVDALAEVDVVAGGTDAVEAALGEFRADLADVRAAAGSDVQDEVTALEESLDGLEAALADTDGPAGQLLTAVAEVVTSGGVLVQELQSLPCD
jgi:hypothetical protein